MIADLKPYPTYKDSGVGWLGEVPEGWRVVALREVGRFIKGSGGSKEDEVSEGIPCVRYGDLYGFHSFHIDSSRSFVTADRAEGYARVRVGDILFAASGETLDEIGKSAAIRIEGPVCAGGDIIILRPAIDVDPTFMGYACDSPASVWQKARMGKGVTVMHIYPQALRHLQLTLPPIEEQVGIGRFLDLVWRRVDDAIHQREQLIDLLEEEKQAVIHRAVTRGLDPTVRLKPSGVDWLGDVPEHWEVRKLKTLTTRITSGSRGWSIYASDVGPRFVRIANLSRGSIDLRWDDEVRLSLPDGVRFGEGKRTRVEPGDLLLSITAYIGSVGIAPADLGEAYVSQHVALARPDPGKAVPRWVAHVLASSVGQIHGALAMYGGTKQGLGLDDVGDCPIPLPPLDEQRLLVESLDDHSGLVNSSIHREQDQIDLLDELRIRLISDVVTGKLDVRDAAARLPADPGVAEAALDEAIEGVVA